MDRVIADAEQRSLAPDLWDFVSARVSLPPAEQLYAWLNYEYARSYRPMVEAVQSIREKRQADPHFAFARMLARHFPEFPGTPWSSIPAGIRADRLAAVAKLAVEDPSPTHDHPARLMTLSEFNATVLPETVISEDTPQANRFFVVEVDFQAKGEAITAEFLRQIEVARAKLIHEFDRQFNVSGKTLNVNEYFKPKKPRHQKGRGSEKAQIMSYMKQLGALRLMSHFKHKWEDAESSSLCGNGKPLFSERKSWLRAQSEAAYLLLRLKLHWTRSSEFASVLQPSLFWGHIVLSPLANPIPNFEELQKPNNEALKEKIQLLLTNDIALPTALLAQTST
jgi:hypothetical protein